MRVRTDITPRANDNDDGDDGNSEWKSRNTSPCREASWKRLSRVFQSRKHIGARGKAHVPRAAFCREKRSSCVTLSAAAVGELSFDMSRPVTFCFLSGRGVIHDLIEEGSGQQTLLL